MRESWAGNLIRVARLLKGVSQQELARRAGTSQSAIAEYETGRRDPSLNTLARIVRSIGLDLRIRLEPSDDHDDWLARYEANLPPEAVAAIRQHDRELAAAFQETTSTRQQ